MRGTGGHSREPARELEKLFASPCHGRYPPPCQKSGPRPKVRTAGMDRAQGKAGLSQIFLFLFSSPVGVHASSA